MRTTIAIILFIVSAQANACGDIGRVWVGVQYHEEKRSTNFGNPIGEAGVELNLYRWRSLQIAAVLEHDSTLNMHDIDYGLNAIGARLYLDF